MELADVCLAYHSTSRSGQAVHHTVNIDQFRVSPLRSWYAISDLLFHSTATVSIDNHRIFIKTEGSGCERLTYWRFTDFPLRIIADMAGGPFKYIQDGTVSAQVEDQWRLKDKVEIHMDWHLTFMNIRLKENQDLGPVEKRIAGALNKYLEKKPQEQHFQFSFNMDEENFRYIVAVDSLPFWKKLGKVFLTELAIKTIKKKEKIKEMGKKGFKVIKDYLYKKRKKGKK